MINTSFELNNLNKSEVAVKNAKAFNEVVEICSALFAGKDTSKYGQKVDAVRSRISKLGEQALAGDSRAVRRCGRHFKARLHQRNGGYTLR